MGQADKTSGKRAGLLSYECITPDKVVVGINSNKSPESCLKGVVVWTQLNSPQTVSFLKTQGI